MKKVIAAGAALLLASSVQLSSAGNRRVEQKIEQEKGQQMQQMAPQQEEGQLTSRRDWAISGYVGMASFDSEEKPDPIQGLVLTSAILLDQPVPLWLLG